MTIPRPYVDAICDLGYKDSEAQFLYLAATHSGFFTSGQFLRFVGENKAFAVHRFTAKAVRYRHVRALEYGGNTFIFQLCSRLVYSAIDRASFHPRSRPSNELILTRLLTLDFVLAHPQHAFLECESQKVTHFHRDRGIPLAILPGRVFKGRSGASATPSYFVDRLPIFLGREEASEPRSPVPNFVYCDPVGKGLAGFATHLRRYASLFAWLPAFHLIYASPTSANFERAERLFSSVRRPGAAPQAGEVIRYFQIRQLWEGHRTSGLTRADRDFLRAGDQRYQGERFEAAYGKWAAQSLSEVELETLLRPSNGTLGIGFSTFLLPSRYPIFERRSLLPLSPSAVRRWGREELSSAFPGTNDLSDKE